MAPEAYASAAAHSAGVNSRPCARAWAALPKQVQFRIRNALQHAPNDLVF
jgi:hypothetical protein